MQNSSYIIPDWPAPTNIRAYTTTRKGGFSTSPYDSFNLALHVDDNPQAVKQNRAKLREDLQLNSEPVWLQQIHSTVVINADQHKSIEADASISQTNYTPCVVMTADCLPVLICNKQGSEVAAVHAGWRGLLNGVIDATIQDMHSDAGQLMAWLGPAISQQHFQVNEQIRIDFLQRNPQNETCFELRNDTDWYADLYGLATINLKHLGVQQIYGGSYCSFAQDQLFYSYRRDQQHTGRMAHLIWMTDQ